MANINVRECEYEKLATLIAKDIQQRKSEGSYRLPSERKIAEQFNCSRVTVRAALDRLANDGFISRFPGRGTFAVNIPGATPEHCETISPLTHVGLLIFNRSCCGAYGDLLDGLRKGLPESEWGVSVWQPQSKTNTAQVLAGAMEHCSGLVVAGDFSQEDLAWIVKQRKPIVVIGLAGNDLLSAVGTKSVQIYHDEQAGYMRAVEYLWSLGYRKPAILMGSAHQAYHDRYEGFKDALRSFGQDPSKFLAVTASPQEVHVNPTSEELSVAAEKIVEQADRFDAVITPSFFEFLRVAGAKGLTVGRDFVLIGETSCADRVAEQFEITELRGDHSQLGKLAAEKLMTQFETRTRLHMRIPVPCELIIRESTPSRKT